MDSQYDPLRYPTHLLDTPLKKLSIPALEPERISLISPLGKDSKALCQTTVPTVKRPIAAARWDGKIHWTVKGPSVFDDLDEEWDALSYRPIFEPKQRSSDVWFFQYGLRYLANPGERDVYRTVKVEKLSSATVWNHILPMIGGEIYCVRLVDTRPITGYYTAIVTFVRQIDAVSFVSSAPKSELRVGPELVKLSLIHTPTYPIPAKMEDLIFKRGYTRSMTISKLTSSLTRVLNHRLTEHIRHNCIEWQESTEDEVYLRFYSVKMAATAYGIVHDDPDLKRCRIKFCRGPFVSTSVRIMELMPDMSDEGESC